MLVYLSIDNFCARLFFSCHLYCHSMCIKHAVTLISFKEPRSPQSPPSLNSLETRQENILCALSGLRAEVEEMASNLGVSLPQPRVKVRRHLP